MLDRLDVVQVVRTYCESPGANDRKQVTDMASLALSIADMTEDNEALFNVGRHACEIVETVIKRSHITQYSMFADSLQLNLKEIRDRVKKHVRRRGFMNKIISSRSNTIRKCRHCLQNCNQILGFQHTEEIWDNIRVLTRQVQEVLEHLRQTSPTQSIPLNGSADTLIEESATKDETQRTVDQAGQDTGYGNSRRLHSFLVGRTDTGDRSRIAGNAVLNTTGTVIHVRGSENNFHITLQG